MIGWGGSWVVGVVVVGWGEVGGRVNGGEVGGWWWVGGVLVRCGDGGEVGGVGEGGF